MRARLFGSLVVMLVLALPALAQDRRGGPSLDRVLPQIRHSVPGTFYDAEGPFLTPDGRATYRIKWMTPDGRMIWFAVDARSGQVLGGTPSGPPAGRYRADDRGTGWGNRGDGRNNWRRDDDRGNGWGSGTGRGGDDRGNGWGSGNGRGGNDPGNGWGSSTSRGGDDRGNGWNGSGRGGDGRGGDGRGSEGRRGDDRGNGWGRGNDRGGNGHDTSGSRGGDRGGSGRSGGEHRRRSGG